MWPTRVRRRALKHAFEQALDEAKLDPDGDPLSFDEAGSTASVTGPAIGSVGGIFAASGYVARSSLVQAYDAEGEPAAAAASAAEQGEQAKPVERPGEAARKLKETLASKEHSPRELKRLRRGFAAQNHPDSVSPELRSEALIAMSEVNAEIDRALKRARPI